MLLGGEGTLVVVSLAASRGHRCGAWASSTSDASNIARDLRQHQRFGPDRGLFELHAQSLVEASVDPKVDGADGSLGHARLAQQGLVCPRVVEGAKYRQAIALDAVADG